MRLDSPILGLALLSLGACTESATTKGSASEPDKNGGSSSGSTSGSTGTSSSGANPSGALEGTWDLTSDDFAASSITLLDGRVTGTIVFSDEGKPRFDGCTLKKHRVTFDFTIRGDAADGNIIGTREYTSPSDCGPTETSVVPLVATRKPADTNANGPTPLEGEWTVLLDGEGYALSVTGTVAKALEIARPAVFATTTLAGNVATTIHSKSRFRVAARKR